MNTPLQPAHLAWSFRDRDAHAACARLQALREALERRGVPAHYGECELDGNGHVIALGIGRAPDSLVIAAVRMKNGTYEGAGSGNPPTWLAAHLESAWAEVS